ncbi:MAG: hypothetical protein AB7O62_00370 [Pirellulales bacterium]
MPDDLYQRTFYLALLSTSQHAEEVEYIPAGQTVGRALTCLVVPPSHTSPQDRTSQRDISTCTVIVGKDESHAKGGVLLPQFRDRLLRSGESRDGNLLAFSGTVLAEGPFHWELEFKRLKTTQLGTTARRP